MEDQDSWRSAFCDAKFSVRQDEGSYPGCLVHYWEVEILSAAECNILVGACRCVAASDTTPRLHTRHQARAHGLSEPDIWAARSHAPASIGVRKLYPACGTPVRQA